MAGGSGRVVRVAMGVAALAMVAACGGGDRASDTAAAVTTDTAGGTTAPVSDASRAGTPEQEMQAVLDQHAKLGPKPIETLTPAEARQQPTPADAVKAQLVAQGKDTTPAALVPGVTSMDRSI